MDRAARGVYRRFTGNADDFPQRGTRWFRDWFYPLWRDCGQAEVMDRFFRELARHFPRDSGGTYTRRMNWGEYIHFTSGAAAADLAARPPAPSAGPASRPPSWSAHASSSPGSPTEIPARGQSGQVAGGPDSSGRQAIRHFPDRRDTAKPERDYANRPAEQRAARLNPAGCI